MITIERVQTKKQQKEFLNFPLKLYKGNKFYAPPLYMDEKKIFRKDFVYNDICEHVYFNAYKDGVMAGRVSGIIQKAANEKNNQKRVRLSRFDVIDDAEVAKALFKTLEDWTLQQGMEEVVGPLNFSDLEREGLLIDGFDRLYQIVQRTHLDYHRRIADGAQRRRLRPARISKDGSAYIVVTQRENIRPTLQGISHIAVNDHVIREPVRPRLHQSFKTGEPAPHKGAVLACSG